MPRRGEKIYKRKDGRWEGRYVKNYDSAGKAKYGSVYAKTYSEAKKLLFNVNHKIATDKPSPEKSKIEFGEILHLWLENSRLKLKVQTYSKYMHLMEKHIVPGIGNIPADKINTTLINKFLFEKKMSGRLDGNGGLSASYIRTISFMIRSALKYASSEGYCNIMNFEIIRPAKKNKNPEILSSNEQIKLEKYILEHFDNKKMGTLLSLYTGLRLGELCGLKWKDVNFDDKTIHVQRTVERINSIDTEKKKKTVLICSE